MTLFMISFSYETNQVDKLVRFPDDYNLRYGWSFYLAWMAFILITASGLLYLLIARAWHMQGIWANTVKQEKRRIVKEEPYSGKLLPRF